FKLGDCQGRIKPMILRSNPGRRRKPPGASFLSRPSSPAEPLGDGKTTEREPCDHQKQRRHGAAFHPFQRHSTWLSGGAEHQHRDWQGGSAVGGIMWTTPWRLSPSLVSWHCWDTISCIPGGRGERG